VRTLGLLARQAGFAIAVFDGVQRDFDFVAGLTSSSPNWLAIG
jgi:hypothetical protein